MVDGSVRRRLRTVASGDDILDAGDGVDRSTGVEVGALTDDRWGH
jgi:hypothetical protein